MQRICPCTLIANMFWYVQRYFVVNLLYAKFGLTKMQPHLISGTLHKSWDILDKSSKNNNNDHLKGEKKHIIETTQVAVHLRLGFRFLTSRIKFFPFLSD